jgi:two-component sensor histidine kinase
LLVLDASLCVQSASRSFFETFKVDRYETIGKHIYELGNGQWDIPALRLLLSDVIPNASSVVDYKVEHDFPGLGRRTMLVTARTLFHPDNALHSLLLSIVDITARNRREALREMQFGEVLHRMKNLLGVVGSIASQMATEGRSAEEFRDAFLGRFAALVAAQELTFSEHNETSLAALVERVLAHTGNPEQVVIEPGAAVDLRSGTVPPFLLILHELATNALKYGALSVPGGRVRVSWKVDAEHLRIRWTESGGPPVTAPSTTGFGTQLIRSAPAYTLGAEVKQVYKVGGLEAEIVLPLRSVLGHR